MPGAAPPLKSPLQTQLYQAGAGAGKTRKLTETIIEAAQKFKEDRGRFPRIVVTTFTRKATQELRERLMLKADEIGDPELTALLVSPSHVHISTIHGVLHTFLARYGHVFGIDPAFEVIDERDNRHLARRALKKVIFDNESYQELLEDFDINLLVHMLLGFYEASMGSEELRAITEDELREAMNEIKADVQAKLARVVARIESEVTDAKWAAFGQILKGIGFELTKADWSEGRAGLMSALNGLKKPTYRKDSTAVPAAVNEALEELMDDLKELKNAIYDPEVWPNFFETAAQFDPLAKAFVAEFRRLKRTEGVLSMGDLELVALRGIRIHPETARNFAAEWDFWLIDEFQDTSPLQNKILLELIGESAYFVVGDPQQSIYLFRGARSEVFQGQRQRIASLEGELHALTANYRSTPQIVHFFNEFFTALSPSFKPMEPKGEQRSKLEAPIVFFKANDAETEAAGIVNHV
ncbi:MAG TPA: UvrD-helicase domain-containing protein, partial [Bdellovibrionales bacterium]|nr:UvrD-helicase domain-containing protein [Bdellovibrionales bacterium]